MGNHFPLLVFERSLLESYGMKVPRERCDTGVPFRVLVLIGEHSSREVWVWFYSKVISVIEFLMYFMNNHFLYRHWKVDFT